MKTLVKEFRLQAGLTQQQLAEKVRVSARTIISIEKEQYSPSLMLAYRLAEVFNTTVEELCCLKENREREDADNDQNENEIRRPDQMAHPHIVVDGDRIAVLYGNRGRDGRR